MLSYYDLQEKLCNLFYKKYCCVVWTNHIDTYSSGPGALRPRLILLNTDEILFAQLSTQP